MNEQVAMSHPLQRRIGQLRARVRRLLALYGLSCVAAAVLGSVVVLGLVDYLIRFQDLGLRVMASLLVLAALGWTCYRYLVHTLAARLHDVDLAWRLQRRFPGLQDRLLSSVQFLRQAEDDPLAGSAALRRAVIAQTTAETERLDFSDLLDPRLPLRAALTTAAVCLLAALLVLWDPPAARIAVARLINPFGSLAWPQRTHLLLRRQVSRVAKGQPFEVEVIAAKNTRLPPQVRIYYRFEGAEGTAAEENEPLRPSGGAMIARRENVQRPFWYRVEGGDDRSMPWTAVEVVTPPAIAALRIRLTPPPYTGWPPQQAGRHIRALIGTQIEMSAETNKPLQAAALHLDGAEPVPAHLSDEGRRFTVPAPGGPELRVEQSGGYWFELTDREGLTGGSDTCWEIRAIADLPPSVAIEQPAANLFVTARAEVPLRITAKDDLAIRQVALFYQRSDQPGAGETALSLDTGPERVEPRPAGQFPGGPESGDRRVIAYRWKLEDLRIAAGSQIAFHAVAGDYRPQTGRSEPRLLLLITPEELQERIASRQGLVLAELERVLKMQRGGRRQVQSLASRLTETRRLEQLDVDHLQAAELNQREVNRNLTSRSEGVPMHVFALLGDLENNKVDSPDVVRRMQAILQEIDRLDRQYLPIIGQQLMAAVKAAQVWLQEQAGPPAGAAAVAGPLGVTGKGQDEVIAALEQMLAQLAQWDSYRRFYRQLAQLLRDQEDLARGAAELGRRTLTKDLKDLTPQEATELRTLAVQQLDLGRRLDRILPAMDQAGLDLRQNDPLAAETVADALKEARRLGISGQMRSCGGNLQDNQLGQAAQRQKTIIQNLQEVLDILANRRQNELTRLVKKLQEAESDLAEIERQQAALQEQMENSLQDSDQARRRGELQRLGREQERLQQQTQGVARTLQRLLADQAGRTAGQAAGQMGQAAQQAAEGNSRAALQQAEAARKSLAEARRQLAAQHLQSQAELALEQLARLEETVKNLCRQQQNVIAETQGLDAARRGRDQLTRAQAAAIGELVKLERSLESETARLGENLAAALAFHLALSGGGREMGRAAALLERRQTGPPTQQTEQNALARLQLILEALKPETMESQPSGAGSGAGGQPQQTPGPLQTFAELKLLKLLQQEINRRTRQLQETVERDEQPSEPQRQRCVLLAEEQGRLAELVLQSLSAVDDNPLLIIAGQMRQSADLIRGNDSGAATQTLQERIVAELEQLIEQARKAPQQSPGGSSNLQPDSSHTPSGPMPSQQASSPQKPSQKPAAGDQRNGTGETKQPDAAQVRALMEQVWGTLPQHQREQVRQIPAEEFLPKYRPLIEEYFRRLAEEKPGRMEK
jgi:hypothetical protein